MSLRIINFLKNLPIKKFYSFREIDHKFQLKANTAYQYFINYFRITTNDFYQDNNKTYYSMKGVSDLLNIEYSRIRHLFPSLKLSFVRIYYRSANNQKISIKKFYDLAAIIHLLPKKYQNAYILSNDKHKTDNDFLNVNPTKLNENQYLVFRSIIEYYKKNQFWPSFKRLKNYITINHNKDLDLSTIYRIVKKLEELKYVTKKEIDKNFFIYYIHKGPIILTHKKAKCYDPILEKEYLMYTPIDTYIEK